MSRPKLEVNEVWILEEVTPFEGSEVLGVFATATLAQQHDPTVKRWYQSTDNRDHFTSRSGYKGGYEPFLVINKHPVHSGKK